MLPNIGSLATTIRRLNVHGESLISFPVARPDSALAAPGVPIIIDLLANDTPLGTITITNVGIPTLGNAILLSDNRNVQFTMPIGTPSGNIASFQYTILDSVTSLTSLSYVTIVCAVEPAVVCSADVLTVKAGDTIKSMSVLNNDTNGSSLEIISVSGLSPNIGSILISSDKKTLIYTPPSTIVSTTSVTGTYTARNIGGVNTGVGTFTITVNPVIISPNPSGLTWVSGLDLGSDGQITGTYGAIDVGNWRGRPIDCSLCFMGADFFNDVTKSGSWAKIGSSNNIVSRIGGQAQTLINNGMKAIIAVPIALQSQNGQFAALADDMIAQGTAYQALLSLANTFRSWYGTTGTGLYLRIGWEADHGYPWSITDPSSDPVKNRPIDTVNTPRYKEYWRAVATIFRDRLPSAKIVWNHLKDPPSSVKLDTYYPGDSYLDVIGVDVYDNGYSGWFDSDTNWNKKYGAFTTSGSNAGYVKGIGGFLAFAKSKSKTLSVDEWGCTPSIPPSPLEDVPANWSEFGGHNNPYFVRRMFQFFSDNAPFIEYESYFNGNDHHQMYPARSWTNVVAPAYVNAWRPS